MRISFGSGIGSRWEGMMVCKKCCDECRDEEDKNGWGEAANATLLQVSIPREFSPEVPK
ncbi:hypothetical protein ACQZ6V_27480 [Agrobacterium sp. 22-3674b3]